jgi:penicillin-binding protein-related factor A (putative recombinase)
MPKQKKKKKKKSKPEIKFQYELKMSLDAIKEPTHYVKIPDMPRTKGSKYLIKKPYDILVSGLGSKISVETKVHTKHTAWPLADVKEHQIEKLVEAKKSGMQAQILVNVRHGKGNSRINFVRIFDIDEFIKIKNPTLKTERKSLTVEELSNGKGTRMSWVKTNGKYVWDVYSWLV